MSTELDNIEYQRALDTYKDKRNQYYTNLMSGEVTLTNSSNEYAAYMDTNRKLYNSIQQRIKNAPRPVEGGGSGDDQIFIDQMKEYATRLNAEHNKSEMLLKKHGFLRGNMIVAQRYAEAERYKKSIWLVICAIILIIGFKTLVNPSSATDVVNTVLFSVVIFLVVYVTEHMGTAPMFLIWLILVAMIGIYMVKHVIDRE
jgi:hypothetical protein